MKSVSVIIPTYNRAYCIENAIRSVLQQTYPIHEIVVVDDCSTDNTQEIVNRIESSLIKYYRLQNNRGAGAARNYGVSVANGEYIAFHDSDDTCDETKIEEQIKYFESHEEVGLVYTAFSIRLSEQKKSMIYPKIEGSQQLEGQILPYLLQKNTIDAPTMMLSKEVFENVGGFDESLRSLEDWDFAIRVSQRYSIGFIPKALLHSTNTLDGVSADRSSYYQSRCYMIRKYCQLYVQYNLFDFVVKGLFDLAEEDGVLQQVKQLLMTYLSE